MRNASINRKTAETDISLSLLLDGEGEAQIKTGCGFLDHMLTLFAHHASVNLSVSCRGDVEVDYHHTAEDIGIALGDAIKAALGEGRGIARYGHIILPMDEAAEYAMCDQYGHIALARRAGITLHIRQLAGLNSHHIIEGAFKAFARALRAAVKVEGDKIPSTKGVL